MVFQTIINFVRSRGPDEFWRKRRIFKLSSVGVTFNNFFLFDSLMVSLLK